MRIVVLSIFEGGYQPITAITAATALAMAGHDVALRDISVDGLGDTGILVDADVVAVAVPLFEALSASPAVVDSVRSVNPEATVVFFGQFATINAASLVGRLCDFVIVGEWERPLVTLMEHVHRPGSVELVGTLDPAMAQAGRTARPWRSWGFFEVPDRRLAPPLGAYPQRQLERVLGREAMVGGLETSRGCRRRCAYCSVHAAYGGAAVAMRAEKILADVQAMIAEGMEHLTFMDADFLNHAERSLAIVEQINASFPGITYDFTTRIDNIAQNNRIIKKLDRLGTIMITTSLHFPSQKVLDQIYSNLRISTVESAFELIKNTDITLIPTFTPFNPWVEFEDFEILHQFLLRYDLDRKIDPSQYSNRLHLYKGSPLLSNETIKKLKLVPREFDYEWVHSDSRVDAFYAATRALRPSQENAARCCLKC
ncbi:MAG: RCCLKC-tail radical SAM protein [Azospirillaceae bacterium]